MYPPLTLGQLAYVGEKYGANVGDSAERACYLPTRP